MDLEDLDSWEQFIKRVEEIKAARDAVAQDVKPVGVSKFLFRGQSNADWNLLTTLVRVGSQPWSFSKYFKLIRRARSQIETFTGKRWDKEAINELVEWGESYDNLWRDIPAYDYLVFLRHHGFPSPLLDWSRSPFVSAYFAFADASSERVAIYAYLEYAGKGKSGSSDEAQIVSLGPFITSHSRHFLQQSEYTFAARYEQRCMFACHEDVFDYNRQDQDRLWKFTLPASERVKVLRTLEEYNLTSYSLFQTDESLMRTIAIKEIDLRHD
ncbi:MAG: FRG domain-containing protein [Pseudomonadota bacterium]